MKCVILCAGYATRLYPLTLNLPKALLPVNERPILDYIVEKVKKVREVDEIIIVSNNKFYADFIEWGKGKDVKILNDNTNENDAKLGGLGDLWFAIKNKNIGEDFMVVLGDNLFESDFREFVDFFKKIRSPLVGLFDVENLEEAKKFGVVKLDGGKIVSFIEKPTKPVSTLISTGIYIYPKHILEKIEEYMKTGNSKDGPGYLISYLMEQENVYGFSLAGGWYDIGSKETYKKVNRLWKGK